MTTRAFSINVDPAFLAAYVMQQDFQHRILGGRSPASLPGVDKMAYLRTQALALTDELHEALGETGWKDWTTSNHINRDAYKGELVDVFIFLMNLMMVGDVDPTDFLEAVKAKIAKNHKRQDDGYDGVSTKCPGCSRAYDDDATKCFPGSGDDYGWCRDKGHLVDRNGAQLP